MGLALQLSKLRMFRKWMAHQQAYEDRDEESDRWAEFIQEWENDKALNRLAESFSAESIYEYYNGMDCPVCSSYCPIEGDTADCNNCEVRWSVINEGTFTYLDAESFSDWADDELRTHGKDVSFDKWVQEEYEDEPAHRHSDGQLSFVRWAKDETNEQHHNAEDIQQDYPFWSVVKVMSDGIDYDWGIEDHDSLEEAKEYCDYYNENLEGSYVVMENESPGEWEEKCAECGTSRKDAETFSAETYVHIVKDKKRDEITALVSVFKEPNLGGQALHHRHEWEDNKEKIISWATNNGYPIQYWEEENYMAQPQKVDTFDAETEGGNQVFNSCWKCGSGQHLYQISRYPASPEEIQGVGANPEESGDDWLSGRPTQRM